MGDRIPYVMIKGVVGAKAWEKAEDPIYVLDNNIPLDTDWYLEHQLAEPIKRLFEPIVDNTKSMLEGDHTRRIRKAMPTTGGLMKFVAVTQRCLGCKAQMSGELPQYLPQAQMSGELPRRLPPPPSPLLLLVSAVLFAKGVCTHSWKELAVRWVAPRDSSSLGQSMCSHK